MSGDSSSDLSRRQGLPSDRGIHQSHSYESEGDDSLRSKAQVVFDLIEEEQWNALIDYIKTSPQAARSRHRVPNSVQYNLPLHEVCRQDPPLFVVNFLLDTYDEAVHTPGQFGFWPLHIACGSGASYDVVKALLNAYPAAARCRDDTKDALPLHFAAQWGASEEVLMEILTTHPEGSFIRDASGCTPLDLARMLPESSAKQVAIAALETAPILVATARSATQRVEREMESRLRGMQEAHQEFIRQMESRHEDDKTEFLQLEVQFHNELAAEKERNCQLAEVVLELRKLAKKETDERKAFVERLDVERREYQGKWSQHEQGIKEALEGTYSISRSLNEGDPRKVGSIDNDLGKISMIIRAQQKMKEDLTATSGALLDREDTVITLKEELGKKREEEKFLRGRLEEREEECREWEKRIHKMAALHKGVLQELNSAKNEMNRLSRKTDLQERRLQENDRLLSKQRKRMVVVKDLVESLSTSVGTWDDLDVVENGIKKGTSRKERSSTSLSRETSPIIEPKVSDFKTPETDDVEPVEGKVSPVSEPTTGIVESDDSLRRKLENISVAGTVDPVIPVNDDYESRENLEAPRHSPPMNYLEDIQMPGDGEENMSFEVSIIKENSVKSLEFINYSNETEVTTNVDDEELSTGSQHLSSADHPTDTILIVED